MCCLMSKSYEGTSEASENCVTLDDTGRRGACLMEIRRSGMVQWGTFGQVTSAAEDDEEIESLPLSVLFKQHKDHEPAAVTEETLALPETRKRERLTFSQHAEDRSPKRVKVENKRIKLENSKTGKKEKSIERWTIARYKKAEERMFEVMKAENAVYENPISRPKLRLAARKHIGDTGLLDHLLKHIDGKIAPGGAERFRRCYNTEGVMEYWLESADLVKIKREAGVPDLCWVPPSQWKSNGGALLDSVGAEEVTSLKEEIAKLKRDMQEMTSRNQEQQHANAMEGMQKEMVKWRAQVDQRLMEISSSLGTTQDMCKELMAWKSKTEQQLAEISSSVSSMQASKHNTTFSPFSERWEDWLESSNLDNIPGEDIGHWLGGSGTDLINIGQDASAQEIHAGSNSWLKPCDTLSKDPSCARELALLKEEMAKMKRNVQELAPKRTEEDQAIVTPDSSAITTNSKTDIDNSFLLFQEMFKELVKWKAKMEQQMLEISNTVRNLQKPKQWNL